jgi:hypothetical protein
MPRVKYWEDHKIGCLYRCAVAMHKVGEWIVRQPVRYYSLNVEIVLLALLVELKQTACSVLRPRAPKDLTCNCLGSHHRVKLLVKFVIFQYVFGTFRTHRVSEFKRSDVGIEELASNGRADAQQYANPTIEVSSADDGFLDSEAWRAYSHGLCSHLC